MTVRTNARRFVKALRPSPPASWLRYYTDVFLLVSVLMVAIIFPGPRGMDFGGWVLTLATSGLVTFSVYGLNQEKKRDIYRGGRR